jgi:hypothetical protein
LSLMPPIIFFRSVSTPRRLLGHGILLKFEPNAEIDPNGTF